VTLLDDSIAAVRPPDAASASAARARHNTLTKPPGSLGRLEELGVWLVAVRGEERPKLGQPALVLAAGDHGVARQGVSAYPPEVTAQMVANFLHGGAAVNVLARQAGARVLVVDSGVASPLPELPGLIRRPHGAGTADFTVGPAMTRVTALACVETGIELGQQAIDDGAGVLLLGDMGIGNTTPAAAITAVFSGLPAAAVTGRGTGVSDERFQHKVAVIERALALHQPHPTDPLGVLAAVGGFEIGVLAGVALAGAAARLPVVLDGFITGSAALISAGLCPEARAYMVASHRSVEAGHAAALDALGLVPLLDLGLRLGEGTGALLALPLLDAAARILDEMATFAEAGVAGSEEPSQSRD
jgi:nicotinate-nucleotide--dimethylbenzimidazole phosphoribosyltransferase